MRSVYTLVIFLMFSAVTNAQLEGIFIERYYIADANDATDTTNGGVEAGESTYRIFIDLEEGSRLLSLFGTTSHPFEISSTRRFFNNTDGASFGYDIPRIAYESNTVALDTYLALGQVGFQGSNNFYAIPKHQDPDGSFIGGVNNDGGSEMIEGGLLNNEDPLAGIPLTQADGMDTLNFIINDWFSFGIVDFGSGADTSIFSAEAVDSTFSSTQFIFQCEGVYGVNPDSNFVLIAQLTTPGELSFRLNTKILTAENDTLNYVGTNDTNSPGFIFAPYLVYPQVCGCTDPDYLEYNAIYPCSQEGACQNLIVYGCTDSLACNYNPSANFPIENICCYPGFCQERDLEEVCPQLKGASFDAKVFPNPAEYSTTVQVISGISSDLKIEITDYQGSVVYSEFVQQAPLNYSSLVNLETFTSGLYLVKVTGINGVQNTILVKL